MIKGTPEMGEELLLSYNKNVTGIYAGQGMVCFHDEDFDSDVAIKEALITKCEVADPEMINIDQIYWATDDFYKEF